MELGIEPSAPKWTSSWNLSSMHESINTKQATCSCYHSQGPVTALQGCHGYNERCFSKVASDIGVSARLEEIVHQQEVLVGGLLIGDGQVRAGYAVSLT